MRPISVLLTNNSLGVRGGSECYVRDVALALLRRGHRPAAFSLVLGPMAADLRQATVPVVDDLTRLGEPPDVIHGHHHFETLIAAMAFPGVPVVNFCHGWIPWEEMPLHHPAVRRYVAVDEVCVDRLVREEGIAPDRVELLLNFVDLERFRPRPPLPSRPGRALILSNYATREGYARVIAAACDAAGITLDVVGGAIGNPSSSPGVLLAGYDLVFAKGRTALEALAVGCATVVADNAGAGPLVTPDNYERLRRRNFGIRELSGAHDIAWYAKQISQYCANSAAHVSARVRAEAAIDPAIERLLNLYSAAMAAPPGQGEDSRAAAIHCCRIARPLKEACDTFARQQTQQRDLEQTRAELERARTELERTRSELDASSRTSERQSRAMLEFQTRAAALEEALALSQEAEARLLAREAELAAAETALRVVRHELRMTEAEAQNSKNELAAFRELTTLRLRDAVVRTPIVGSMLQSGARRFAKLLRR